jgi:hypothetical protein
MYGYTKALDAQDMFPDNIVVLNITTYHRCTICILVKSYYEIT